MANPQNQTRQTQQEEDPFESLLELEDKFYQEGHAQGVTDGARAGLIEGRVFGLEKGFEKYLTMGQLHGRAVVWGSRLYNKETVEMNSPSPATAPTAANSQADPLAPLTVPSARLEKHIRTLFALVDPASLPTENTGESVSDFDDRLKRARAKVKVIERLVGEEGGDGGEKQGKQDVEGKEDGRGIEI